MGARERAFRRTIPILLLLAVAVLGGCRKSPDSGRIYTVRAQVVQLPDPANPGTGLTLSHEAIDDWTSRSGEVMGMDPMSMPFPVGEGVSLAGIQAGDVVEVKLRVDWGGDPEVAITEVRKLPAGTKLVFRAANPPKKSS
jgi:hypothetical protein